MKLFIERFPTVAAGLDVEPQHVALALHRLAVAGQQDVVSPHLGRAAGRRLLLRHPLGQQVPGDGGLRDRHLAVKLSTSIREVGAFSVILKLREGSFTALPGRGCRWSLQDFLCRLHRWRGCCCSGISSPQPSSPAGRRSTAAASSAGTASGSESLDGDISDQ